MMQYHVKRVLNNNIVQCHEKGKDNECILLGKGIGFQKKQGDIIDNEMIEKIYHIQDQKSLSKYEQLVKQSEEEVVAVVEDVIEKVGQRFGNQYSEYLHVTLLDHLNFSIYRYKNEVELHNIFLDELSIMYEQEYAFSKEMLAYINETLAISLPESEVGFITMHVHSALKNTKTSKTAFYSQIIGASMKFIEEQLDINLDPKSLERARLVTHLKFALERAKNNVSLSNPITESLKDTYPETCELARKLSIMVREEYGVELPEGEIGYLALHIQNIILSSKG